MVSNIIALNWSKISSSISYTDNGVMSGAMMYDDAEMFTSKMHDPCARITVAWKR